MRNLKKILALVLALVMSLSLMATAGAAETTAAAADPYATAQTVLTGLKVFRGDTAGQMNWNQPITRVQTAALVYRINTGDVDDTKAGLHTSNPFADVATSYWGNSYISYGYNAGILKGMGGNNFAPDNQVTGYQTLAMILRAMGYGRNGEFEGTGWEVRTASTAQSLGLLKNVTPSDSTTLGQPASRGLVAEILLRALLTNKVMYSALNPYNYTELDEKLADNLDLEEIKGAVVIANEWAALDDTKPLAANKTKVELADGTTRTLNWSAGDKETGADYATGVMDIGKSRDAYIQGSKVLALADSGKNVVADNGGKGEKLSATAARESAITSYADAEHFTNFAEMKRNYSDWRIEIRLNIAPSKFGDGLTQFNVSRTRVEEALGSSTTTSGNLNYVKVIPANEEIYADQIAVMKEIFRIADDSNNTLDIKGEVYVGTKSVDTGTNDVSDTMSWKTFEETYIKSEKTTVSSVGNGNWLQVVDNNADGKAEYVLLVNYDLDEIVETKNDKFYYRGLNVEDFTPVTIDGYTQTVGDVVLYAKIDGKAYVHKADTVSATFKDVNYKDRTATTTDGDKKEQSDIGNYTTKPGDLTEVDELTNYNLYLDDYGYVRAYDNNVGYALLTEMYPTGDWNSAWVVNRDLTVEAMPVGEKSVKEYKVLNSTYNITSNPFFVGVNGGWWYPGITNARINAQYADRLNYLQPATHMLGVSDKQGFVFDYAGTINDVNDAYVYSDGTPVTADNADLQLRTNAAGDTILANGWNYGNNTYYTKANFNRHSWTNVAKYTQTSEGLNLYTAAGTSGNVTTDYIRLDSSISGVSKTNPLFTIEDQVYDEVYTSAANHYVRAVDSTVFYLVTVDRTTGTRAIRQYTGYSNVPTLTADNEIRSMYAVAHHNNSEDYNTNDRHYWVGDVIVIEMYSYNAYESISLVYSNNYKNQGDVKYLEAIDSLKGEIRIIPNSYNVWNGQFSAYGFYGLNNIIAVEGQENTYTADITRIYDGDHGYYKDADGNVGNDYNKYGIYYGQVRSLWSEDGYSNYITLDVLDENGLVVDTKDVRVTLGAWAITEHNNYNSASQILLRSTTYNNKVERGDKVMWVETSGTNDARTAGFLVDLTDHDVDTYNNITTKRSWYKTPDDMRKEANRIAYAQWMGANTSTWNYEEIIGKRNDQTKAVTAGQDGFVIDSYELSVYNVTTGSYEVKDPLYSRIEEDGLWHIHYALNAGDIVMVTVVRNDLMGKDLVLNSATRAVSSTKYTNGIKTSTGSGIDVYRNETWTFEMPNPGAGKVVVGTIFEDSTTIPADARYPSNESLEKVAVVYGDAPVYIAYKNAFETLTKAAETARRTVNNSATLTEAQKAERLTDIQSALTKALSDIRTAAEYPKYDVAPINSALAAGETAINNAAAGVVVDDEAAKKELEEAKAAALAKLKGVYDAITDPSEAVTNAYNDAVAKVNAATTPAEATTAGEDGVKAINDILTPTPGTEVDVTVKIHWDDENGNPELINTVEKTTAGGNKLVLTYDDIRGAKPAVVVDALTSITVKVRGGDTAEVAGADRDRTWTFSNVTTAGDLLVDVTYTGTVTPGDPETPDNPNVGGDDNTGDINIGFGRIARSSVLSATKTGTLTMKIRNGYTIDWANCWFSNINVSRDIHRTTLDATWDQITTTVTIQEGVTDYIVYIATKEGTDVIEYPLTVNIDEGVESVKVTVTEDGKDPKVETVTADNTKINVPKDAAVAFEVTYAEGYEAGESAANIDAMTGPATAGFTSKAKDPDAKSYVLTVTIDEGIESVKVTVTEDGKDPEVKTVTETNTEISVPEGAAVAFEVTYAGGFGAGETAGDIEAMTGDETAAFTSQASDIEEVEVTVKANTTIANKSLKLVNNNASVTEYKATTEGGKLTITAKVNDGYNPYVILNGENKYFTASGTGADKVWTLTVDVPEKTTAITVTAEAYYTVELTAKTVTNNALTIVGDAKKTVLSSGAAEGVTFTVMTSSESAQPKVNAANGVADVAITPAGEAKTYTVELTKVAKSGAVDLVIEDLPYVKVTKGTDAKQLTFAGDSAGLETNNTVAANGGKYTIVVDAKLGYQPQVNAGNYFTPVADAAGVEEGYARWETTVENIAGLTTVVVDAVSQRKATLNTADGTPVARLSVDETYKTGDTSKVYVACENVNVGGTDKIRITATFTGISLMDGFTLEDSNGGTTLTFTPEDGEAEAGHSLWTVTYTEDKTIPYSPAQVDCEIKAVQATNVTLKIKSGDTAAITDGTATRPADLTAVKADGETSVNYAKYILKLDEGKMPFTEAGEVRFVPLGDNLWEVTLVAGDEKEITVESKPIPSAQITRESTGGVDFEVGPDKSFKTMTVTPFAIKTKDSKATDKTWDYTGVCGMSFSAEFTGITSVSAVSATVTAGSGDVEAVEDGAGYKVTVTAVQVTDAGSVPGDIAVLLSSESGTKVTLSIKPGVEGNKITEIVDGNNYAVADAKGMVQFMVKLDTPADDTVVEFEGAPAGVQMDTQKNGDIWTLTFSGLSGDSVSISVFSKEAANTFDWAFADETFDAAGIVNVNPKFGNESTGKIDFVVTLDNGYYLTEEEISATATKDGTEVSAFETNTDNAYWTVTVTQGDAAANTWNVTITVEQVNAVDKVTVTIDDAPEIATEVSDSAISNATSVSASTTVTIAANSNSLDGASSAVYEVTVAKEKDLAVTDAKAEHVAYVALAEDYELTVGEGMTSTEGVKYKVEESTDGSNAANYNHYKITITIDDYTALAEGVVKDVKESATSGNVENITLKDDATFQVLATGTLATA